MLKSFAFSAHDSQETGLGCGDMESFIPVVCFVEVVCQPEAEITYTVSDNRLSLHKDHSFVLGV